MFPARKVHFRHLETSPEQPRTIVLRLAGNDAIAEGMAQEWFAKFQERIWDLKGTPRCGQPS